MEQQAAVVEAVEQTPVAVPASGEGTEEQNVQQTDTKPASEVAQEKDGEQHRSRQWRRLDRWRQRAIEAETRLKLQEEQKQGNGESQSPAPKAEDAGPQREQFPSYESFIEARADWRAEQTADRTARKALDKANRDDEQQSAKSEHEKVARAWNTSVEKARDEIEDFDEVCAESDAIVTDAMKGAILESDKAAHIAYYLAKNPGEAERISKLTKSKQAVEIVKLEEKVSAPPKQATKAPEPINPVGQKGAEVDKDPARMSDAEFNAWRKKQISARRR